MRLVCPNCGAQYEVPDEVIPDTGRDVQCSDCGDTWYQHHPDHPPAEDAQEPHPGWDSPAEDPAPEPEPQPEPQEAAAPEPEPESTLEPEPEPEDVAETASPSRRELDPSITDVLRQEAAFEERARSSESGGLETQPELGLDQNASEEDERSRQARARMARMRGLPEETYPEETTTPDELGPGSRRNLLPDIDEINSSLNSDSNRADMSAASDTAALGVVPRAKGGFRRGFMLVVLVVVLLVLLYVYAPRISAMFPGLEKPVSSYVEMVNAGRIWLDGHLSGVMGWLKSMSSAPDS